MKKTHIVLAVLIVAAGAYFVLGGEPRKGIFLEKLPGLTIDTYSRDGDAREALASTPLESVRPDSVQAASYSGRDNVRIVVADINNHDRAYAAFEKLNGELGYVASHGEHEYSGDVGQTGAHTQHGFANASKAEKVSVGDLTMPQVFRISDGGATSYYYLKSTLGYNRIFWITFGTRNDEYQTEVVAEVIEKI